MTTSYYPWNVQVLIRWLKQELTAQGNLRDLATALQVPIPVLMDWFKGAMPIITLQHIRGIAQYRGWSVQQTLGWLELKPAHVEELIAQDALCDRTSWNDAKAQ
jgi:hypothetical protein